jgi:hypothetical protein
MINAPIGLLTAGGRFCFRPAEIVFPLPARLIILIWPNGSLRAVNH